MAHITCTCDMCGARFDAKRKPRRLVCSRCIWRWARIQSQAQNATRKAVLLGLLPAATTLKCADCGADATEYDHRDYAYPLAVEPTCRSCNLRRGSAAISVDLRLAIPDRHCDRCGTDITQEPHWYASCWCCRLAAIDERRREREERATSGAVTRYELRPDVFGPAPGTEEAA